MPLVPVVDDAGRGTALNPVPILARSLPREASSVIGSGESMSAPSGLGSWDDRDRAHVAFGFGTPRYLTYPDSAVTQKAPNVVDKEEMMDVQDDEVAAAIELNRMKLEDDRSACYRADELQARELKLMKLEDDRSACRRADKRQEEARAAVFKAQEATKHKAQWKDLQDWVAESVGSLDPNEMATVDLDALTRYMGFHYDSLLSVGEMRVRLYQLHNFRGTEWIDDAVVRNCAWAVREHSPRSYFILDSLIMELSAESRDRSFRIQLDKAVASGLCVWPMNYKGMHWCVIILDFTNNKVVFFDPLQSRGVYGYMVGAYKEHIRPEIRSSHPNMDEEHYRGFKQEDGYNCGIYILEFIGHYPQTHCPCLRRTLLSVVRRDGQCFVDCNI